MQPNEGPPIPGNYPDCDPDQIVDQSPSPAGILSQLDELLAPTGGSYSASGLPMKQAIQYSIIALNRQNHDALMQIIGVLAQNVVGRVQYCEDMIAKLAAPFRRTIRGRIKAQENVCNSLINQLSSAVCARTAYAQQMLGDCQCKMLGAEQPTETAPEGEDVSGMPSLPNYLAGRRDDSATPAHLNNGSTNEDIPLSQWLPRVLHDLSTKTQPATIPQQCCNAQALVDANNVEWLAIMEAVRHNDPESAMKQKYGTMDAIIPDPPPVGMEPSPIEDEHFPIEDLS
jgi:hypothetical protein